LDITFRTRKLEKTFNSAAALQKAYGARMAKAIMNRLAVLKAARTLALVPTTPPDRRHQLRGDRDEQFAVDLVHPYRLIFEPNHDPLPRKDDGGLDVEQVTAITIIDVVDYH
jgi:proteic killer suppression protein